MKYLVSTCVAVALLVGCGERKQPESPAAPWPSPRRAFRHHHRRHPPERLRSWRPHKATLPPDRWRCTASQNTVHLSGSVQGLAPDAEFGFHIHEKGDCSAPDASSASTHFNPSNAQHGNPAGETHHAGDMFNAKSDTQGVARIEVDVTGVTWVTANPLTYSAKRWSCTKNPTTTRHNPPAIPAPVSPAA